MYFNLRPSVPFANFKCLNSDVGGPIPLVGKQPRVGLECRGFSVEGARVNATRPHQRLFLLPALSIPQPLHRD